MESFHLTRHDLLFTNSLHRHTVRVLPSSKKKHQKIVVGDESGTLTCIAVKSHTPTTVFRNPPGKRDITALDVQGDRIYTAYGHAIHGVQKKKGTTFLTYATPLSEDILHLSLTSTSIYTACDFSINAFTLPTKTAPTMREGQFYQTPDRIGGIVALEAGTPGVGPDDLLVVGTHDKCLRIVRDSEVQVEHRTHAPVATLVRGRGGAGGGGGESVWWGGEGGGVGEVRVTANDLKPILTLDNPHHRQTITSLTTADLSGSGSYDVVLGHDDGTFHVYPYPPLDPSQPSYTYELHESIVSLDSGCIHSPDTTDLVVATYSGKVLTFGQDTATASIAAKLNQAPVQDKHKVMVTLQSDIDGLAKQLAMYKEKLSKTQVNTDTGGAGGGGGVRVEDAAVAALPVKATFRLSREDACYILALEIPVPMDLCVLHCPASISVTDSSPTSSTVLSVQDIDTPSSTSASSPTPPPPSSSSSSSSSSEYIATLRATGSINRLALQVRHMEGVSATLTAHLLPRIPPSSLLPRTSGKAQVTLRPLHLHDKCSPSLVSSREALSSLTITGSFSLSDLHTWLSLCLPGIPPHTGGGGGVGGVADGPADLELSYEHVYTGSVLGCKYRKGYCRLESDYLSALSVLKEWISGQALGKKVQLQIGVGYDARTVPAFLARMRGKLELYFGLQEKVRLIDGLQEVAQHEEGWKEWMESRLVDIVEQAEELRRQWKEAPQQLDMLRRLLTNLWVDKGKLQGRDVSRQSGKVRDALDQYSFDGLLQLFKD